MQNNNALSADAIKLFLNDKYNNIDIQVFESISSTNTVAKQMALYACSQYTTLVANSQTAGRGRVGKTFYSPANSGIYLSTVISAKKHTADIAFITILSAVAVCKAIEELTSLTPTIKWVNDIFIDGKKSCGILTEAVINPTNGTIENLVIGIGINFSTTSEDFPDELKHIATSLNQVGISRNQLIATILNNLFYEIENFDSDRIIKEYRSRMFLIGKNVTFTLNDIEYNGIAKDIDSVGHLIVECSDNITRTLHSGEVSIKY